MNIIPFSPFQSPIFLNSEIFELAASDSDEAIVELAFQTINKIVTELYITNMAAMIDSYQVKL